MKVALVLAGSIWYSPFVRIYTRILDKMDVDYSLISWNREGDDKQEGFQYNEICANGHGSAGFYEYKGYVNFIKKTILENNFEKIIVFGPQITCLLSTFLLRRFRGRYMIDYRDLSFEQKSGFKQLYWLMTKFSRVNVISSPGFKRCLPNRQYYISHNFDVDKVKQVIKEDVGSGFNNKPIIDVLTIGGIRDYSSNIEVVKALGNKPGFKMRFVGKGAASQQIEKYCNDNCIDNIEFTGYYKKDAEPAYIKDSTFLNIFYPRIVTHDTAMSNRFYNSLIYKRPMIVTKNTTQGNYAEKYGVGIALENCRTIIEETELFLKKDYQSYARRCNELLSGFLKDQDEFEKAVKNFIMNN